MNHASPIFRRYPKTFLAAFILAAIAMIAGGSEWIMRRSGYLPAHEYFSVTKQLTVQEMFKTDGHGVFKANPQFWAPVAGVSINSDGFRGPEFTPPDPHQRSVLILGDSFAWGIGADPLSNSFADLVRAQGHRVYNTGIPGVDPSQYRLVADLYIPKLKPDDVVVSLYAGNDLLGKLFPVMPNHNLIHVTNVGWLMGFDACDRPLTAQESYDYYIGTSDPLVERLLLSTSIGTAAWNLVMGANQRTPLASQPHACADGSRQEGEPESIDKTFEALQRIHDLAVENGSQFHLLVIPTYGNGCNPALRNLAPYRERFDRLNPIYLDDMPEDQFYDAPNCHVRNSGHRFIADRILSHLAQTGEK